MPLQGVSLRDPLLGCDADAEAAYVRAASVLRAVLPARARSVWAAVPNALYHACTPLGRAERAASDAAHTLARHALRVATRESPLRLMVDDLTLSLAKTSDSQRQIHKRSDEDALHAAATLLFAGHDTQAATMAWCMLRLADDVQTQTALRRACAAAEPAAAAALLDATIRETLRLHPPAPLVVRALHGDAALQRASPHAVAPLPVGAAAAVWLHAVQRDEMAWGADAATFRPERWLSQALNQPELKQLSEAQAEAYMPFAAGPRICPGAALATAALRVTLRHLACGLTWQPAHGTAVDLHPSVGFTVTPAAGVPLRLRLAS